MKSKTILIFRGSCGYSSCHRAATRSGTAGFCFRVGFTAAWSSLSGYASWICSSTSSVSSHLLPSFSPSIYALTHTSLYQILVQTPAFHCSLPDVQVSVCAKCFFSHLVTVNFNTGLGYKIAICTCLLSSSSFTSSVCPHHPWMPGCLFSFSTSSLTSSFVSGRTVNAQVLYGALELVIARVLSKGRTK